MTEKPIQFSAPMVRAILDGRKTQTRRVVKPQPHDVADLTSEQLNAAWQEGWVDEKCPYGDIGNYLWVREAWQALPEYDQTLPRDIPEGADIIYNADRPHAPWDSRKRNALYMPRWASRITLKITDVRVERIQDISEDDARAEGITAITKDRQIIKYGIPDMDGMPGTDDYGWPWKDWQRCPVKAFRLLWQSIHGGDPVKDWAKNPLVWVIEFESEGVA